MTKRRSGGIVLKISKSRCAAMVLSVFVLAIMIEPAYISAEVSGAVHEVYRVLRYAITVSVLAVFFFRRGKLNLLMLGMITFEGCLFISTLYNGGDIQTWARSGAYCVVLLLFMQMVVSIAPDVLLKAVLFVLGLYVHINTLTWILYPDGLYVTRLEGYWNCWFLGYDNCAAAIIIFAEIVALFRIVSTHKWFNVWSWSIIISGTVFIFGRMIATIMIAEVVAVGFLLLVMSEKTRRIVGSAKFIVVGMIVLFLLIQFFNIQENSIFTVLFLLLGKSTTFTGRTRVWRMGWDSVFPKHFLLGEGMQTGLEYVTRFGGVKAFTHLHCYYLQVFYDGGVLAFVSFVLLLLIIANRFDNREKYFGDMVILAGLLVFMIVWQVEAYPQLIWYFSILMVLLYNISAFKNLAFESSPRY